MTKPGLPGTRGRKRVYLMRHGEVSYRRPDGRTVFSTQVALTEEGVEQARHMRAAGRSDAHPALRAWLQRARMRARSRDET
jgi:broad specificity phosphatase PhoE